MSFRFSDYTVAELEACGRAFVNDFATATLSENPEWTCAVCEWFRNVAAPGICVYPPASGREDEFMVDLCHTTYPLREGAESWLNWYQRAVQCPVMVKLALESEWGKYGRADLSLVMVLDDACKLALLRSQTKVMVFSSHWDDPPRRVPDMLEELRACHVDTDPWLWLDVPNDGQAVARTPRDIRFGVIR